MGLIFKPFVKYFEDYRKKKKIEKLQIKFQIMKKQIIKQKKYLN